VAQGLTVLGMPVFGMTVLGMPRMSDQEEDAADAWQRIYAFFGEHLGDNLVG
jgi:hypothetical protein